MRAVVVATLAAAAACGSAPRAPAPRSGLPLVRVVVESSLDRIDVEAEVAATPSDRERGLMHRREIPRGTGMLFVFPSAGRRGFWMKDTLVPLTILFIRDRRVVEIRDMQPCLKTPCPLTTPDDPYDMALEVPLGAGGRVGPGAVVSISGLLPTPE